MHFCWLPARAVNRTQQKYSSATDGRDTNTSVSSKDTNATFNYHDCSALARPCVKAITEQFQLWKGAVSRRIINLYSVTYVISGQNKRFSVKTYPGGIIATKQLKFKLKVFPGHSTGDKTQTGWGSCQGINKKWQMKIHIQNPALACAFPSRTAAWYGLHVNIWKMASGWSHSIYKLLLKFADFFLNVYEHLREFILCTMP